MTRSPFLLAALMLGLAACGDRPDAKAATGSSNPQTAIIAQRETTRVRTGWRKVVDGQVCVVHAFDYEGRTFLMAERYSQGPYPSVACSIMEVSR